jgi:hypothetical protein
MGARKREKEREASFTSVSVGVVVSHDKASVITINGVRAGSDEFMEV